MQKNKKKQKILCNSIIPPGICSRKTRPILLRYASHHKGPDIPNTALFRLFVSDSLLYITLICHLSYAHSDVFQSAFEKVTRALISSGQGLVIFCFLHQLNTFFSFSPFFFLLFSSSFFLFIKNIHNSARSKRSISPRYAIYLNCIDIPSTSLL